MLLQQSPQHAARELSAYDRDTTGLGLGLGAGAAGGGALSLSPSPLPLPHPAFHPDPNPNPNRRSKESMGGRDGPKASLFSSPGSASASSLASSSTHSEAHARGQRAGAGRGGALGAPLPLAHARSANSSLASSPSTYHHPNPSAHDPNHSHNPNPDHNPSHDPPIMRGLGQGASRSVMGSVQGRDLPNLTDLTEGNGHRGADLRDSREGALEQQAQRWRAAADREASEASIAREQLSRVSAELEARSRQHSAEMASLTAAQQRASAERQRDLEMSVLRSSNENMQVRLYPYP